MDQNRGLLSSLGSGFGSLPYIKRHRVKQVSTHTHDAPNIIDPTKMHQDYKTIPKGSSWSFPEMKGPGCIRVIWMTAMPTPDAFQQYDEVKSLNKIILRFEYDGKVEWEAPFGAFYGLDWDKYRHWQSEFLGMTSGGYYSYFPMPFRDDAKVTLINKSDQAIPAVYGAITYQVLNEWDDDLTYFHVKYNPSEKTPIGKPYKLLEAKGCGHYAGCAVNMKCLEPVKLFGEPTTLGFLEGNLKIFVDDDKEDEPSLEYTGTEDYFMSGWFFNKGPFSALRHGLILKDEEAGLIAAYRFHDVDAVPFKKQMRVILHHGEFDEVKTEYSSTVYYYMKT